MFLNYLWIAFFLISFLAVLIRVLFTNDLELPARVVTAIFEMADTSVEIALGLIGLLAFWTGLLRIAEVSGLINLFSKAIDPLFTRLFPGLPANHGSKTPIIMNVAANMLGLDNAATPLGLNAMKQMQEVNDKPDTATDAQIMLLVLNTSGLTIIPITVIMYRAQMGAANPTDIFIPTLLATLIATIGGIVVTSFFQKNLKLDSVLIGYGLGVAAFIGFVLWYFNGLTPEQAQVQSQLAGNAMLLIAVGGIIFYGLLKKVKAYEVFVDGAKEGFTIAVEIIPYLVAMLIAVGVLRASGILEGITQGLTYLVSSMGMDTGFVETIPIAIMRPLSGSGARALMLDLLEAKGADSFAGKLASVMQGTTDTTLYIVALYFGAVKITKTRYAIPAGLSADLIGVTAAILLSYMFFG